MLAGLALLPPAALKAEDGGAPAVPPQAAPAASPAESRGLRLFDDAVHWLASGRPDDTPVRDFMVKLDAKLAIDGTRHEGPLAYWLQLPDLYRQELTLSNATTAKILRGDDLYVRSSIGPFRHVNRTPDGASAVQQMTGDRRRMIELTRYVTLGELRVSGAVFEFEGETTGGPGGTLHAKVVRKVAGKPNLTLWLAQERDSQGELHATHPNVVRVDGDPLADVPTEDYLLQDWREAPAGAAQPHRFPRKILAFKIRPSQAPINFLTAIVTDLKLNAGIDPTLFEPK